MNQIKTKSTLLLACGFALAILPGAYAGNAAAKSSHEAMFKAMDTDGNGSVSRVEYAASGKQMFDNADTNHNGTVTLTEMTAACNLQASDMAMKADKPVTMDKALKTDKSMKANMDTMSPADMIKLHDQNSDGQLSAAEQKAGCDMMFDKLDTNKDDKLSLAECEAGRKMMMKKAK